MSASKLKMVVVVMIITPFLLQSTVSQTRHVVGDTFGWAVPEAQNTNIYTTWASQQTFNFGDTLFFNFTTGAHDVTEVSHATYDRCTITTPVSNITTGPATLNLKISGNHYYICTVGRHCQFGQKLTINVAGATASPSASTTLAPIASASSFTAVVRVTFLAATLAFLY